MLTALEPLDDGLGEHVERQVVGAAALRVRAAHAEAAEGLYANQGAGDLAVEVDVAGVELVSGQLQVIPVLRVDAAGQAVGVVVGDAQRFFEVAGLYDGEDGAENLLLRDPRIRLDLEERRRHEVTVVGIAGFPAQDAVPLLLAQRPCSSQPSRTGARL